jgi:drug/metabolite transporter (DMT)-like permease
MTIVAFALVFAAALIHATWNLLAKRVNSGLSFIFLLNLFATLIYTPIAISVFWSQHLAISLITIAAMLGSAVIHILYFVMLQKGYQSGDLSLVYPLARGTGPLLSTLLAIGLLGERPTHVAMVGILLIVGSVVLLTGNPLKIWQSGLHRPIVYGLLTGALIAAYTVWDKYAVSHLSVSPVLLNYGCNAFEAILLLPIALTSWHSMQQDWNTYWREVLGVAILSPIAYILVLIAMTFTPLSYVAPIRELSILVGVVMGHRLLAEGEATRRLVAASIMILGILTLALN